MFQSAAYAAHGAPIRIQSISHQHAGHSCCRFRRLISFAAEDRRPCTAGGARSRAGQIGVCWRELHRHLLQIWPLPDSSALHSRCPRPQLSNHAPSIALCPVQHAASTYPLHLPLTHPQAEKARASSSAHRQRAASARATELPASPPATPPTRSSWRCRPPIVSGSRTLCPRTRRAPRCFKA